MVVAKFLDQSLSINLHHTVMVQGCDTINFPHRERRSFAIDLSAAPKNEPLYICFACEGKHLLRATNVYACAFFFVKFGINHAGDGGKVDDTVVLDLLQAHLVDGRNVSYVINRDTIQIMFLQIQCFNTVTLALKLSSKMRTNETAASRDKKRKMISTLRLHVRRDYVDTLVDEFIDAHDVE